jgi:hypothetical protein
MVAEGFPAEARCVEDMKVGFGWGGGRDIKPVNNAVRRKRLTRSAGGSEGDRMGGATGLLLIKDRRLKSSSEFEKER